MSAARSSCLSASSVLVLFLSSAASGKTRVELLHTFTGQSDGGWPAGDLVADKSGTLYGTTEIGGPNGAGVVFKMTPGGTETPIFAFNGPTGDEPEAGLLLDDAGNLYGTTEIGGANGWGAVFRITPAGQETVLYSFLANGTDGINPTCQLIWGPDHTLLGTTLNGGKYGYGTVFQLTLSGQETILHAFNGTNGRYPSAGVVRDKAGNLFGTTFNAGQGSSGTVYEIDTAGQFSVLHRFSPRTGYFINAGVTLGPDGTLYGTTQAGGAHDYGTVYSLVPGGAFKTLHSFTNGLDGSEPVSRVRLDHAGNLLGMTNNGGPSFAGVIYSLAPDGTFTTLYSFGSSIRTAPTGEYPKAGLIPDPVAGGGWFYGPVYYGGNGNGTVIRVHP